MKVRINNQRGVGMVELMISMVIGLFLVAATSTVYLTSKTTFNVQEWQSSLHENARMATLMLGTQVRQAGYHTDASQDEWEAFASGIEIVRGTDGSDTGADTLTVRYQSDGMFTDCIGNLAADGSIVTNQYVVDTTTKTLQCSSNGGIAQVLIDGVENLQLLYGVDSDGDGTSDTAMNATAVQSAGKWARVVQLRMVLLVVSDGPVLPQPTAKTISLLDLTPYTVTDRLQRRSVERVVSFRNRLL